MILAITRSFLAGLMPVPGRACGPSVCRSFVTSRRRVALLLPTKLSVYRDKHSSPLRRALLSLDRFVYLLNEQLGAVVSIRKLGGGFIGQVTGAFRPIEVRHGILAARSFMSSRSQPGAGGVASGTG